MRVRSKVSALTPLNRFPRCQWHHWNGFSGLNDTAEIRMTPLKPKNNFESPYLILKRTSSKTISWVNIPIRCNYFNQKKLRNSKLHFRFQRCHWHRWNRFWRLSKQLSRRIRSHMRNGFSLLMRDLYGVDWWKPLTNPATVSTEDSYYTAICTLLKIRVIFI
jgi:hypothetical protein